MRSDADIVVVGAGIVGVATARALASDARSVILLERFEIGHTRGSSHGASRIFRLNYADARFVRLAQTADEAWRELEDERGEQLVERVGVLDLGPAAAAISRTLATCGVTHETLSAHDVTARWPLRLDADETAVHQPDGGYIRADRAHATLLAAAMDGGVELREGSTARTLSLERGRVCLELDGSDLTADAVVVAAGAWGADLLATAGIGLPVVPTRETVVYLELPDAEALPPVIDYGGIPAPGESGIARAGNAWFALAAPGVGLKAGLHHAGPVTDPDDDPAPEPGIADRAARWATSRYANTGAVLGAETCIYTNTADEAFVLERHGRIVVGSACSGHGFKFAPLVGRTLAALAREAAG